MDLALISLSGHKVRFQVMTLRGAISPHHDIICELLHIPI